MKTCGFENQINLYLDAELSGAKLRSFEAHLQQCPRCREEVEQYRELLGGFQGLEDREVPTALQDRLHAALSDEISKGDGRVKRKLNPWALSGVAAGLMVFVLVGALLANGGFGLFTGKAPDGNMAKSQYFGANNGSVQNAPTKNQDMLSGAAPDFAAAATAAATMAPAALAPEMESPSQGLVIKGGGLTDKTASGYTSDAQQQPKQPGDGRKLIYTANLAVETREYTQCMDNVNAILQKYGGYVENSQSSGVPEGNENTMGRVSVVSMRLPVDKYDSAMLELQGLGNLLNKNEYKEDVSRQYVDTEARNKEQKLQRDRLFALLQKADTMENIIALQNEITRLTVLIEQDTAQLNFWDDKVAYSTITVEVRELVTPKSVKPADPDLNSRVNGAWYNTLNNMKKGMEGFAVAFVGFLPWLVILIIAAGLALAVILPATHKARKAAKEKKLADNHKEEKP